MQKKTVTQENLLGGVGLPLKGFEDFVFIIKLCYFIN